ncbi:acyltransferase [uncultured Bacteroides sp.]|jgi:hypothetical protein|uniref:acyltransferase family protein n=1 Tax=uncultured Bacteroides sp. TaxID=162156 RepID=UPI00258D66C2|nr:acyltransferase [uncultured Bacteroides sp.]
MLKNELEKRQSELIEALRFPLIVLVVFIHVLPERLLPIEMNFSGMNIYHVFSETISHIIGRIAVPCFFLFSGYFFFRKSGSCDFHFYRSQLKKRCMTLVIPYFLWNALMIIAIYAKQYIFSLLSLEVKEDGIFNIQNQSWVELFWLGPVDFPLWYLRDLICMSLCAPLFYCLFRYLGRYGLLALLALYLTTWETRVPGFSMTAFFFFGAGAYWGIHKENLLRLSLEFSYESGIGALLLLCCAIYNNGHELGEYLVRLFIPFGIVSAINLMNRVIGSDFWKRKFCNLSVTVFFIYAIHEMYIINWTKGFFSRTFLVDSAGGLLLVYILTPVITVIICLLLYYLLNRTTPKILAFLVGGRVATKISGGE